MDTPLLLASNDVFTGPRRLQSWVSRCERGGMINFTGCVSSRCGQFYFIAMQHCKVPSPTSYFNDPPSAAFGTDCAGDWCYRLHCRSQPSPAPAGHHAAFDPVGLVAPVAMFVDVALCGAVALPVLVDFFGSVNLAF